MNIRILELKDGEASSNVKTLLDGTYHDGIEFEIVTLREDSIPVLESQSKYTDYVHGLHEAPEKYDPDVLESLASRIMKDLRSCDYLMCPVAYDDRGFALSYMLSWITSYTDSGSLRGIVYYLVKEQVEGNEELLSNFTDILEMDKVVTKDGDVLYLDLHKRDAPFFKQFNVKLES